jgi:hypothetical protein
MKNSLRCLGSAVALSLAATVSDAAFIRAKLDDLASGPFGSYGLRLDNAAGMQTFSFEPGVVMDFYYIRPGRNAAVIHGTVVHNESGQFYDIEVYFKWRAFTNADATDWRTNTSGNLYKQMLLDFIGNGNDHSFSSLTEIHDAAYAADRIAFNFSRLTLRLQSGQGSAVFVPHYNLSRIAGLYRFYHYPQGSDTLPFVIAKGLTLDTDTDRLVGHVELDPRGPRAQSAAKHIYQQELLFLLTPLPLDPDGNPPPHDDPPDEFPDDPNDEPPADPIGPPTRDSDGAPANSSAVPEPSTLALMLVGLTGAAFFARRKNSAE